MTKITDFKTQARNANKHTQYGLRLLEKSLREDGFIDAQTAAADGEIISGSARLEKAVEIFTDSDGIEVEPIIIHSDGKRPIIVIRDDIPNAEHPRARRLSVAANKIAQVDFDPDWALLKEWGGEDEQIKKLFSDDEWREGTGEEPALVDAEPQIDRAAELQVKWQTETGQLWKLGDHRLLIGSSLERDNWVRLCGDERATLTWTDPPYGVKYGEKLESANPMCYRVRTIENEDLPADQLEEFVRTVLKNCAEFSGRGAAIYVASPAGTLLPAIISAMAGSGYDFRWHLVWLKDQIVLSRADYHFKHENILYGWKPDGAHYFIDDRKQASVFEYPRPKKSEEHPTMKPVELVEHMIRNSSRVGDIVLEPFGGSGTTLLACERQKRICRIIELSEKYGAVILQRFYDATGIQPELATA